MRGGTRMIMRNEWGGEETPDCRRETRNMRGKVKKLSNGCVRDNQNRRINHRSMGGEHMRESVLELDEKLKE
jgi:hypothetical protein